MKLQFAMATRRFAMATRCSSQLPQTNPIVSFRGFGASNQYQDTAVTAGIC